MACCVATCCSGTRLQRQQFLVAGEVKPRVVELSLVTGELAFSLRQRRFERPVVELREEVARVNKLAFVVVDLGQLSVGLAS